MQRELFWPALGGMVFTLFILFPLVSIFVNLTPSQFIAGISEPLALQALKLSAGTTLITTVIVAVLGVPMGYVLAKGKTWPVRLMDAIVDLPMVLPPAVAGLALLMAFGRRGLLGGYLNLFGIGLPFTTAAVIVAQIFVAGPFFIRSARNGFAAIDHYLEQASLTLGKTPWQTFWQVSIPLCAPSLLSGAVMTWARALGEFGATIMFAGNLPGVTQTLPLAIYTAMERDLNTALAMAAMMIFFSFLVIFLVKVVWRQG